ncbi:MAG TPA: FKBP-type peptidyl-prolyl cis-trans isomerase [Gemmatales bacterium]|nr:FKBP-type peptidyl-prolyl cis-trans isomerase [Gemmatales bacterium]
MQRHGGLKRDVLFVLLFVLLLGVLAICLTMREDATEDQSFVRSELLGSQPKPQPTFASPIPDNPVPVVKDKPKNDIPKDLDVPRVQQNSVTTESGLKFIDQRIGEGDKIKLGSQVEVIYTGWLQNGEQFDSNEGKAPFKVTVGVSSVIKGWHEGLIGMQTGGKRKLIIPEQLAWGERGYRPKIPPHAEVTFEIEVVSVINK